MQESIFIYTASGLGVSSYTGIGTEFSSVSAGLAKVWQMVSQDIAGSAQELSSLMYNSTTGSLAAVLSNGSSYGICGARFHGEISSCDAGSQLSEKIRKQSI